MESVCRGIKGTKLKKREVVHLLEEHPDLRGEDLWGINLSELRDFFEKNALTLLRPGFFIRCPSEAEYKRGGIISLLKGYGIRVNNVIFSGIQGDFGNAKAREITPFYTAYLQGPENDEDVITGKLEKIGINPHRRFTKLNVQYVD